MFIYLLLLLLLLFGKFIKREVRFYTNSKKKNSIIKYYFICNILEFFLYFI